MGEQHKLDAIKYFIEGDKSSFPEKLDTMAIAMVSICKAMDMDFKDFKDYTRIELWEKFRNAVTK